MPERDLSSLAREELETEVRRLRTRVRSTSVDKARQNAVFDSALDFAIVVTDPNGTITADRDLRQSFSKPRRRLLYTTCLFDQSVGYGSAFGHIASCEYIVCDPA